MIGVLGSDRGFALDAKRRITQYAISTWRVVDGLPQNTAQAIAQTRDGYLWIGTQEGLARFDGTDFSVFNRDNTPAFRADFISRLMEDRQGNLWIGTYGEGLLRWQKGVFTAFSVDQGLAGNFVLALFQDRTGRLWIGTNSGLSMLQDGVLRTFGPVSGLPPASVVWTLTEDDQGRLWVGTTGGVWLLEGGRFRPWPTIPGLAAQTSVLRWDPRLRRLWCGTNSGLGYWEGSLGVTVPLRRDGKRPFVSAILSDDQDNIWIGTQGDGLYRLGGGNCEHLGKADGLSSDVVTALREDREGNLWVGTGEGLCRLSNGKFLNYSLTEGLRSNYIRGVCEGRDGTVWIATYGGGLHALRQGEISPVQTVPALPSDLVLSLATDADDVLWVCTMGSGICRITDGQAKNYTTADGLPSNDIRAISTAGPAAKDGIWIGAYGGGLSRFVDGRFHNYGRAEGLTSDVVRTILTDRQNRVWVGTESGLFRQDGGRFRCYGAAEGLEAKAVLSLFQDSRQNIWVGTLSGGLSRYDPVRDRFDSLSTPQGLAANSVFSIQEDDAGNLWMSCNLGVFCVARSDLEAVFARRATRVCCRLFTEADGMRSRECNGGFQPSVCRARDGRLWFPTKAGLAVIDPRRIPFNRIIPPVHIEAVLSGETTFAPAPALTIPPGNATLEFRYCALSLTWPRGIQYRYRLEGFDADWIDAGNDRKAKYTNVPPGRYRFRVIACNNDGVWNETGASLEVELQPFFYQRTAFRIAAIVLGLLLLSGVYLLQVNRLKRRSRELSRLVELRTMNLREEKEKTEQARREAEASREIAEEASRFKTELLHMAAHDLKNPLQGIMACTETLRRKSGNQEAVEKLSDTMLLASQRMIGLIDKLLKPQELQPGLDSPRRIPFSLNEMASRVLQENHRQAEAKSQELALRLEGEFTVSADPDMIEEVMDNLVSNAVKYSPVGKPIRLLVLGDLQEACFVVEDEGPGIAPGELAQLFEKFQTLGARPTGGESSTGLGLAIARKLARMNGGDITVDSRPGAGSRFTLHLPRN